MKFNLSNVKTAKSRNGLSMTAKFFINDLFVADFEDDGNGGEPFLRVNKTEAAKSLFTQFEQSLETLPEIYFKEYDHHMKIDKYFFIDMLHAAIVNKQKFNLLENA